MKIFTTAWELFRKWCYFMPPERKDPLQHIRHLSKADQLFYEMLRDLIEETHECWERLKKKSESLEWVNDAGDVVLQWNAEYYGWRHKDSGIVLTADNNKVKKDTGNDLYFCTVMIPKNGDYKRFPSDHLPKVTRRLVSDGVARLEEEHEQYQADRKSFEALANLTNAFTEMNLKRNNIDPPLPPPEKKKLTHHAITPLDQQLQARIDTMSHQQRQTFDRSYKYHKNKPLPDEWVDSTLF